MKYGIYYFSGTGNSLWSAKRLAELLGDAAIYPISQFMITGSKPAPKSAKFTVNDEAMILIYPAYAYEAPLMVRRFVKRAQINSKRIIALTTYGSQYGGALSEIKRLLKRKGHNLDYADGIKCVENYIPVFGKQKDPTIQSRLANQVSETERIAENIRNQFSNKIRSFRPLSKFVSIFFRVFKPLIATLCRVKKTCNGCGICEKVCPAKAIVMVDKPSGKRPKFKKRLCEQCQCCYNYCPQKSHSLFRLKPGKYRYRHPEISLPEILKQANPDTETEINDDSLAS